MFESFLGLDETQTKMLIVGGVIVAAFLAVALVKMLINGASALAKFVVLGLILSSGVVSTFAVNAINAASDKAVTAAAPHFEKVNIDLPKGKKINECQWKALQSHGTVIDTARGLVYVETKDGVKVRPASKSDMQKNLVEVGKKTAKKKLKKSTC